MPDDELEQLAARNELRANLPAHIPRMLRDDRSRHFVRNFVGQWLQARDIDTNDINPLVVLGAEDERERLWEEFMRLREERHAREDAAAKQAGADRSTGNRKSQAEQPGAREERSPEDLRIRARLRELNSTKTSGAQCGRKRR
jgi:hypothetical protein